ncbi:MAG: hypothetical protein Q8R66_05695 [Methanobacteriaceae archaeon]|nr:hypothetical protein [Methanobacteriaceae archaeon]
MQIFKTSAMKEENFSAELLPAVYNILNPLQDRGMVPLVFRFHLGGLINEDEDDVLLDIEEILINSGWIIQDSRSRFLMVSDKLREFIEE